MLPSTRSRKRLLNLLAGLMGLLVVLSSFTTSFSIGIFGILLIVAALVIERKEFEN